MGAGPRLVVLAVWSGDEQRRFEEVLHDFERRTGTAVTYVPAGHRIADALDDHRVHGTLPDVAFLPQPGLLRRYVEEGLVTPVGPAVAREVSRNYTATWQRLGTVDGRLYGLWFKAANKSLVWYSVGAFERAGVIPPDTTDGLLSVARAVTASGTPAFSLGGADGWTLTDWFENLYLRLAGAERYDLLSEHRLAWTDDSVKQTLRALAELWAPDAVAGGPAGALGTTFEESVQAAFGVSHSAAMVVEGDFVQGVITAKALGAPGVDVDVFAFPSGRSLAPEVVGGGDAAVILRDSPAAHDLLRYLASPAAATIWAAHGGFVSPNVSLDLSVYPDPTSRSVARQLIEAGDRFRFDLSDLQPTSFGGVEGRGMRAALQDLLRTGAVDATATRLEADAGNAYRSG